MAYLNRQTTRKTAGSAELVYLLIVLAAGAATFWYAGHKIGMDLSSLAKVASVLGIRDSHPVRYDPRLASQTTSVQAAPAMNHDEAATASTTAPYCNPGQSPAFVLGLAELKQRIGNTMGTPVECEHPASAAGDTVQQTSTGLAAYSGASNTVTFTDGWHHWALRAGSVLTWEGTQSEPPTR